MENYYFIFELIYRNSKYSELIQNLEELGIDKLCITSDKNKEIQTITYSKSNDNCIRQKFAIDDKVLEPLGLSFHNMVYLALEKSGADIQHSVLEQFQHQ